MPLMPSLDPATLLWAGVVVLALSTGTMAALAARQVYAGYRWWLAAQALLLTGLLLHTQRDAVPALRPLAALLILQWPVATLAGLRRFFVRDTLPLPAVTDALLFGLAYLSWLAVWAGTDDGGSRTAALAGGALLLHGHAAFMLTRLSEFRGHLALRLLAGALACSAAVHGWHGVESAFGLLAGAPTLAAASLLLGGLALLAPAWLMPVVALLLFADRHHDKLRAANRKLRVLADIDVLTRVSNRRHFQRLGSRLLQAAPDGSAALMMFDIDHFKRINDLLGHASGDEALRQVARCMRDTLRGQDVAGRLGGDEFAVLLPQTSVDAAMSVAARIVGQLDNRQVAPRLAPVSLSFGVVQVSANETLAEALRRADQALYEAKRQGRSRAVVATGREERPVFGESRPLGLMAR